MTIPLSDAGTVALFLAFVGAPVLGLIVTVAVDDARRQREHADRLRAWRAA